MKRYEGSKEGGRKNEKVGIQSKYSSEEVYVLA